MEWLTDLIDGIGDAIAGAFASLWEMISSSIWGIFLKWIYEAIFGAIADFFTLMGNMGTDLFDLPWVQACVKLFSMFGWALFVAGLVVAIFDIAIEYQSMRQFNIKRQVMPLIYGFLAVNLFTVLPIRLYTFCITIQNTLMANAGMNPKALQYIMGHANIVMTLNYYAHATFQSAQEEMARLEAAKVETAVENTEKPKAAA